MNPAVETLDLTKTFVKKTLKGSVFKRMIRRVTTKPEHTIAVDHVNMQIGEGELFGLLGPNGAGKTSTIKLLCTLLVPDQGTAKVNGYDIVKEPNKVRQSVGVVTGGERGLYWRLTARENLLFFARMYDMPDRVSKPKIDELLKLVELDGRADETVEKYSRGMKQRLHLIRGLIHDPAILLLDEPTLGLDPASARVIRDFVKQKLQREQKKTILLTTHYMDEADQLCDRIAIIDNGKVIGLGTPTELKKSLSQADIIQINASNVPDGAESLLKNISGISEVALSFDDLNAGHTQLRIHTMDSESVLPEITQTLVSKGVKIHALQEIEPTLEDVFIGLTGRKLRD